LQLVPPIEPTGDGAVARVDEPRPGCTGQRE